MKSFTHSFPDVFVDLRRKRAYLFYKGYYNRIFPRRDGQFSNAPPSMVQEHPNPASLAPFDSLKREEQRRLLRHFKYEEMELTGEAAHRRTPIGFIATCMAILWDAISSSWTGEEREEW